MTSRSACISIRRLGLLLRKTTALPTFARNSPFEVNYSDYRNTGTGLKFPYLIMMTPAVADVLYGTAILQVTKVEDNKTIENAKIARPESKPGPPQQHSLKEWR